VRGKETPPYRGGPAIIFRMDDADKGFLEDTVEQIIQIFEENNVPVDVGIMPYSGDRRSYHMPFLLKYLDAGVIDITMHGYRNTFSEFDTEKSGFTFDELDEDLRKCFVDAYGQSTFTPTKTYYTDLYSGLLAARAQFKHYFGVTPISFTVPNDLFNEDGYKAAQNAGFKIFSSQIQTEQHPSSKIPVDFSGHYDENGMYRIPSVEDLARWNSEECALGDIITLTSPAGDLDYSFKWAINNPRMGVAVFSIHPQAFVDAFNKPDPVKLDKLEKTVKYIVDHNKTYGQIITFQSWYNYITAQ